MFPEESEAKIAAVTSGCGKALPVFAFSLVPPAGAARFPSGGRSDSDSAHHQYRGQEQQHFSEQRWQRKLAQRRKFTGICAVPSPCVPLMCTFTLYAPNLLVAVGMYLPFGTTFAIFVGGVFRSLGDWVAERRGFNSAQKARVENAGVLVASGLIAGEALLGLVWAGLQFVPSWGAPNHPPQIFSDPSYLVGGMIVLVGLAALMIFLPVSAAGDPSEPAPPTAIM